MNSKSLENSVNSSKINLRNKAKTVVNTITYITPVIGQYKLNKDLKNLCPDVKTVALYNLTFFQLALSGAAYHLLK